MTAPSDRTKAESSSPGEPPLAKLARQPSFSSQSFGSVLYGSRIVSEKPNPSVISYQPSL